MWSNASVLWNFFLSSEELNVVLAVVSLATVTCSLLQLNCTNSHNRRNNFVAIKAIDVMARIWLEADRRLNLVLICWHCLQVLYRPPEIWFLCLLAQGRTHYVIMLWDPCCQVNKDCVTILLEVFLVDCNQKEFINLKKMLLLVNTDQITFHKSLIFWGMENDMIQNK